MGDWGYKNFENDTALDWYSELNESKNKDLLFSSLSLILDEDEFIDDEESFISLAILELLNIKLSNIKSDYIFPDIKNTDFVLIIEMVIKASKKLLFIENHSELRELWEESDEYEEWFNYQINLLKNIEEYYIKNKFIDQLKKDNEIDNKYIDYLKKQ